MRICSKVTDTSGNNVKQNAHFTFAYMQFHLWERVNEYKKHPD